MIESLYGSILNGQYHGNEREMWNEETGQDVHMMVQDRTDDWSGQDVTTDKMTQGRDRTYETYET